MIHETFQGLRFTLVEIAEPVRGTYHVYAVARESTWCDVGASSWKMPRRICEICSGGWMSRGERLEKDVEYGSVTNDSCEVKMVKK